MTKWDKVLIVFVILVSLLGLYFTKGNIANDKQLYALIKVNGEMYKKIALGPEMNEKTLEVRTKFGYNKLLFGKDRVRVIEADCPDKLDVKQGWISKPGEVIVCLPNRLVIELVSEDTDKEDDIDSISY
ncbi:NusG domain II-containing protein [Caldisalinibacter kiritimatiensis]|uniref:Uncharacterized protein n=1 Tax=Caldisalinibacter kiritimatiensis TaxID=1304284 RepID=R1ARQ6_9FIRM|nr:NusG domain II-containing protein [Caldisalinibacter kiritimatiensis]EOC99832.1 protein of unknown function DUF1312 [Caldisalinibacter kiritimatiensis]